jgi:hypothetical protein
MLNRRRLLVSSAAFMAGQAVSTSAVGANSNCIFGAIRWDAQYCDTLGQPCFEEEKALSPSKWQFRAPLHSQVVGPDRIQFVSSQATFDQEIIAASRGGLKYWAYLMYGERGKIDLDHSMMKGLYFHRSSNIKEKIKYAMIVTVDTIGYSENYSDSVNSIVSVMHDSNYQAVLGGRPVLYLYYIDELLKPYWGGSLVNLREALDAIRVAAVRSGLANPYIILMSNPLGVAETRRSGLRADAVSAYAIALPSNTDGPYENLAHFTQDVWQKQLLLTSADVVPTAMIGWDTRPRKENPPAYDHGDRSGLSLSAHIVDPSPAEFAMECQAAVDFIRDHPERCASRLGLIYAWNENSEGGALEPTLGDAIAAKLASARDIID